MTAIKFFFKQIFEILYHKIKDSVFYNTLVEKHENLDLQQQKWIKQGLLTTLFIIVTLIPASFVWSSIQKSNEFKTKHNLVNRMLQTSTSSQSNSSLSAPQWNEKINQLTQELSSERNIRITPYTPSASQIPSAVRELTYVGKKIQIENSNIQEVVDIGYALNQMDSSVKLIQLKVEKNSLEDHYFKATYFLFLFFNPKE